MKKSLFAIIAIMLISCNSQPESTILEQIWISDNTSYPELLLFTENECFKLSQDIDNFDTIHLDTLHWNISKDSMELFSLNQKEKFRIITLHPDSLIIEYTLDSYTGRISYYSLKKYRNDYSVDSINRYFIDNSFIAKYSISNDLYHYDFITQHTCIEFDSVALNLEYWNIQKFGGEIFFISRSPVSSTIYHLKSLDKKRAEFEYYRNGKRAMYFEKTNMENCSITKKHLIDKWYCRIKDTIPQLPLSSGGRKDESFEGVLIEFNKDMSYKIREGHYTRTGTWKLKFNNRYILLADFDSEWSVLRVKKIDDNILTITYRNRNGETQTNDFRRIGK